MGRDLGLLFLEELIVHDVPRRRASDPTDVALDLSGAPAPDDPEVEAFFKERITATLSGAGQEVYFVKDSGSAVPELVEEYLVADEDDRDLVAMSQQLARHLFAVQNYTNPAGLLTICTGRLAGAAAVAVLKLKREEGVRLATAEVDGKTTLSVEFLKQLMLTEETKLFKAALFWVEDGTIHGLLSDEQQPRTDPAAFFLSTFLGCDLVKAPDLLTKRFADTATDYIRDTVEDPATKVRYYTALQSELASNKTRIAPQRFIADHIEPQDQDQLARSLTESGVPSAAFEKDTGFVKSLINRKSMRTKRGIRLTGPREIFDELVTVKTVDGSPVIEIADSLEEVG